MRPTSLTASPLCAVGLVCALAAVAGCGNDASESWFGVALPPGLGDPHRPVVDVSAVRVAPATVPDGEEAHGELDGDRIAEYAREITDFSVADRAAGHQAWGRVTGRAAAAATSRWVAEQFNRAGLAQVEMQEYEGSQGLWWPTSWEVRLLGDDRFGEGTLDVVLESAFPSLGIDLPEGGLTAGLVDAGSLDDETRPDLDVAGKVAVLRVRPASGVYSVRGPTVDRSRELFERGAVAVLTIVEQTGNMHVRDFRNCGGPCFALGTADGAFLSEVMAAAGVAGLGDALSVQLQLEAEVDPSPVGHNVLGIVPGASEENIIVNAHVDGWFDGAGDNGDGLAVLIAMARHFAQPEHRLDRTLVFVASGGHHTPGLNGPSNVVAMNPELTANTVLVLNLEHVAQYLIPSGDWTVGDTEQPMSFGISNLAPFIVDLGQRARSRYGFNINEEFRASVPGDLGGYRSLGVPRVQAIHSGTMYHTSGDVFGTLSVEGLERAARFYTYFVQGVAAASREELHTEGS